MKVLQPKTKGEREKRRGGGRIKWEEMKGNSPTKWSGGKQLLGICGYYERNIYLNEKGPISVKKLAMFPLGLTIILGCNWASVLIDNLTINTKKEKGVLDKLESIFCAKDLEHSQILLCDSLGDEACRSNPHEWSHQQRWCIRYSLRWKECRKGKHHNEWDQKGLRIGSRHNLSRWSGDVCLINTTQRQFCIESHVFKVFCFLK